MFQKAVAPKHRGMDIGVKCSKEPVPRVAALIMCLYMMLRGMGV